MLSKPRLANPATRHPRHAFTMVEILVTIGIILILMGIVLVAVRRLGITSKEHATHVTLSNLQAMLNDYGSATGFKTQPAYWILDTCGTMSPSTSAPYTDFWKAPSYLNATSPPSSVVAPENVSDGGSLNVRMASQAVLNTLVAMNMICRVPANRTAISNMPPQSLLVPTFISGQVPIPTGTPGWLTDSSGEPTGNIVYPVGCHVQLGGQFYVSLVCNSDSSPAASTTDWRNETSAPQQAPLLLDGWGNPIIFVPASGLNVLMTNGGSTYDSTNTSLLKQTITAPDHRPFWVSAGPDGDFTRGDDNVYSFDQ